MSSEKHYPLLTASDIEQLDEDIHVHQFNSNAVRHTKSLGDLVGLDTIGIHLVRIEAGKETTQYHSHQCDEEFIYILSGRGRAEIGENGHEVGPGDFMAFGRNSLPHTMSNPFKEDLTYLMGGNRNKFDVCDYPRLKRRMYRIEGEKEYVEWEHINNVDKK